MSQSAGRDPGHLLRELAPQVLGALMRRFRDFAAAEDAVQEALLAGATQWPVEGVPANPLGWLVRVATRRMLDHLRSEQSRRLREATVAAEAAGRTAPAPDEPATAGHDDALLLMFMCCHPSLTTSSAIALTLRAVGGLTTAEIARAFLVPELTMAQRISRAKQTVRAAGAKFSLPGEAEWRARLGAVLHVLYLIFNEGYTTSAGETLVRTDLSDEAIRLIRAVHGALPDDPEVTGLLALMLLTDARRPARTGPDGELIPLMRQDRTSWDRALIEEGTALVESALSGGAVGPYQVQAAIAALHDEAADAGATDWPQILALYGLLRRMSDNPMVELNHAIALAMVHGPRAGLERLDELESDRRIGQHHRLAAARAHLLERAGDLPAAIDRFLLAADRATSVPERNYLLTQAARLREQAGAPAPSSA